MLYERALVLASGILPYRPENFKWLRYSGVSNELVQLLTEKLKFQSGKSNMHDLVGAYERMKQVYRGILRVPFH